MRGRRVLRTLVRLVVIALAMSLTAGGVLLAARFVEAEEARPSRVPPLSLDARSTIVETGPVTAAIAGSLPATTRFLPGDPTLVLDTRGLRVLAAGAEVTVQLRNLPVGTTAVLLEVSLLAATGPGEVTLDGGAGPFPVLRLPRAGAQTSATVVTPVASNGTVRARTGGGHLLINQVGVFQAAEASDAGRILPLSPVQVLRLVPKTDGKRGTVRLAEVPALRRAGPISALLLQVAGDVGTRGGFVEAGSTAGDLDQKVFWSATKGADRTRGGFLAVPVTDGAVHLHYEAGTEMRVDLVGYVTGEGAATTDVGLVVPVPPRPLKPVRIAPGAGREVEVVPAAGLGGVAPERVAAALVTVAATGDAVGDVFVHAPGTAAPRNPALVAPKGMPRAALALSGTVAGTVRVDSAAGAAVTLTPRALVLR